MYSYLPPNVNFDEDWLEVAALMLELGGARVVHGHGIPRHAGRRVLAGAFGVRKVGAALPDGSPVLRLIMDLRSCNELMRSPGGRLDDMALPSQFLSLLMQQGEVLLVSGEDLKSIFYFCRLPDKWAAYFCFERELDAARLNGGTGRVRIGAIVLPMGFCNATACLQTWHRRLALSEGAEGAPAVEGAAGLDRTEQICRTRPHPWSRATSRTL